MEGVGYSIVELIQMLHAGIITINEARQKLGFEPFPARDADVIQLVQDTLD